MIILPENVPATMPQVEIPIMPKTYFWECQTMTQPIHMITQIEKTMTWI